MAKLIDTFLNQLTAEEKRDKTREQYGGNLRRFERWLLETHSLLLDEEQVGGVTGLMLTEFYQHLHARGLKVSTRNAYVIALMEFFRFLQNAQVIADNPARVLHTVKEKKKACDDDHKQYTQAEIEALLSSMEKGNLTRNALRDTAMVALALGSGLRAFELCSLNVSHLSGIQNGAIVVERKGGGWSEVSVADFVYPHVARYLLTRRGALPNEPLFLSQKGNRMTPNSLWKTLAYKEKQLGLKTGVHIFRYTFLSDIEHDSKGGAAMARDLAGHKSIQITNTYLHTTPQERKEAVNHMGYAHLLRPYKTKTADRDALTEIKAKAMANKFDILLVFMFDRLGRREDETPFVVQWFVENGIEVWSVKEGQQRFDTHVDKLLNYIRFWQASGESEKTSLRIRTKHLQMIQEGLYRGGLVPFGYRLEHLGRTNKKNQPVRDLVIDEAESAIVKEIYYKIISEGWGTNRIANWLNERGIQTKRGKPGAFWRATSIRAIVRNPIYIGKIRFGDELSESFEHLRIIDDFSFNLCEQILEERIPAASRDRTRSLRSTSPALLTGILFCGSCGGRMCFNHNSTVKYLADGTRRAYERDVYRCYRKVSHHGGCSGRSTYPLEKIEEAVLKIVHQYFENIRSVPTVQMLAAARQRSDSMDEIALANAEEALQKAQAEMSALEDEAVKALTGESKLDISFINGLIPKRRAALEKATEELARLRGVIAETEKKNASINQELKIILSWADAFDSASTDVKRSIISALIDRITVYNDCSLDIHFRISAEQFLGKAA